jgi:hypothetical protein
MRCVLLEKSSKVWWQHRALQAIQRIAIPNTVRGYNLLSATALVSVVDMQACFWPET